MISKACDGSKSGAKKTSEPHFVKAPNLLSIKCVFKECS